MRDLRGEITERLDRVGTRVFGHWYEYDGRGLLSEVYASTSTTKASSADVIYTYRPSGEVESRQYAGGQSVPLRYTIREQLERIGDPASTSHPFSARYIYHPNGTISEADFYNAGTPTGQPKRYKYAFGTSSYDALNRLKGADYSYWNGAWASTAAYDLTGITYDESGNLRTLKRNRENGTLIDNLTYTYPGNSNRLSSVSDAVGASSETWDAESGGFTYDANGNLKTAPAPYGVTAASYDHRNLPLSLTSKGVTTSYRYDHAGQRIAKRVGSGDTEVYLLDGATTLGVFRVNSSGIVVSHHFNVLAGGRVVGRQPNTGNRRYYHTDLLGSTRAVVEGSSVVESYDYDPWGLLMPGRTLGSGTKEGFTSKERDTETGLDYFGARLYMPALGRWTGVDPLADGFPEWSPYNYVFNNPVGLTDPDGRCPMCIVAIGVIEVGSTLYDIYEAWKTSRDPNASGIEKGVTVAGVVAGLGTPGPGTLYSKAALKAARQRAVSQAWKKEADLVRRTGRGTRDWADAELDELLTTGKVKDYQGHHINSVKAHPEMAGDPDNIKFVKAGEEHLREHGGNYRNPTSGPLIKRDDL